MGPSSSSKPSITGHVIDGILGKVNHRVDLLWTILHFQLTSSASAAVREGTHLSSTLRFTLLHFGLAERS